MLVSRETAIDGGTAEALDFGVGFSLLGIAVLLIADQYFGGRALKAFGRGVRFIIVPRKCTPRRDNRPTKTAEGHISTVTVETARVDLPNAQVEVVVHPRSTLHRAPGHSLPARNSGVDRQSPVDTPTPPHMGIEEVERSLDSSPRPPQLQPPQAIPHHRARVVTAPPSAFIRPSRLRGRARHSPPSSEIRAAPVKSSTSNGDKSMSHQSNGASPHELLDEQQDYDRVARNSRSNSIREGSVLNSDDDYISMVSVSTVPPSYTTVSTVPPSYHTGRVLVVRPLRNEASRPRPLPPVPH
ncbi:hypothetical protein BV20DRAFT_1056444 [Pilatotrama ljubarskyi]|nr:hypothetical protein BV20DRAFT_1056444 [Pilatotrama ljubarskyi]